MTITRATAEGVLVSRLRGLLAGAGLAVTTAGSNADLNEPLATATLRAGGTVTDRAAVTDADLATVSDEAALLDLATLATLETIAGHLAGVDVTFGPHSEKLSQLAGQVERMIARWTSKIAKEHGIGRGQLTTGVIGLSFQQQYRAPGADE